MQLIALLPSRCRESGDVKFIRNMSNLSVFCASEDCWFNKI